MNSRVFDINIFNFALLLSLFFSSFVYPKNISLLPSISSDLRMGKMRYNEVQIKASQNSRTKGSLEEQLAFRPDKPWSGGCLGLELPIVQNPNYTEASDGWEFAIQSGGKFQSFNPKLREILEKLRNWSDLHPGHHVVTLHIDLKSKSTVGDDRLFCKKLDEIIAEGLSLEKVYTPAYLQRNAINLLEAIKLFGWPTLDELRNSFILVLSGDDSDRLVARRRLVYTYTNPYQRLMFVDLDQRILRSESAITNPHFREGMRVFFNIKAGKGAWTKLAREAQELGVVTRAYNLKNPTKWEKAKGANVNILTTSQVRNSKWTSLVEPLTSPSINKNIASEKVE